MSSGVSMCIRYIIIIKMRRSRPIRRSCDVVYMQMSSIYSWLYVELQGASFTRNIRLIWSVVHSMGIGAAADRQLSSTEWRQRCDCC